MTRCRRWQSIPSSPSPSSFFLFFRFTAHLGLEIYTLFVQFYSASCRPSDHTVGRPGAENRTWVGDLEARTLTTRPPHLLTKFFVTFNNLRKINFDEFLTILPKNYDSEINNKLKTYRYRRTNDEIPEITEKKHQKAQ